MIISGFESVGVWVRSDRFLRSSHGDIYTCSISDWAMCNNCKGIVCASCKTCDGGGGFADGHSRSCGPIKFVVTILYNICITITVGVCPSEGNTSSGKAAVLEVCHSLAVGQGGESYGKGVHMFSGVGAISGYLEGVLCVLRQTCEGSGIFIVSDVVGHLIVIYIKYNVGITIGIASVACPADGGTFSGDVSGFGSRGLVAGGSWLNCDVVDVYTVGCTARVGCLNHDGHIALGSGSGDIEGVFLIVGDHVCRVAVVGDFHEGAGICRVSHTANLEGAGGIVTTGPQFDAHAS